MVGAIQVLHDEVGGRIRISEDQHYETVQSNVSSVTRLGGGVKFPEKNVT